MVPSQLSRILTGRAPDMGHQPRTLGVGAAHVIQLFQHPVPVPLLAEEQDEVDLAVIVDGQALHPVHLLFPVLEIGHQAKDALAAQLADDLADAQQFGLVGIGAGHGADRRGWCATRCARW